MNLKSGLVFLVLAILPQSGCMTSSQMLEQPAVSERLHNGESRDDVRRDFGVPQKSEIGSNGKYLDVYVQRIREPQRPRRFGTFDMRSLTVLYDEHGKVEKFAYSAGVINASIGVHKEWQAGERLDLNQVKKIRPGATTREDLIQLLGRPTFEGLNVNGNQEMSWYYEDGKLGFPLGHEFLVVFNSKSTVDFYSFRNYQPWESREK